MQRISIIVAALVVAVIGCGSDDRGGTSADYQRQVPGEVATSPTSPAPPSGPDVTKLPNIEERATDQAGSPSGASPSTGMPEVPVRQIIRTGQISLTVPSLDSAERRLTRIVTGSGGYIAGSQRSRAEGSTLTGQVEIRIPSTRFDVVVDSVRRLGRVEHESISASDVTEEYIDLEARLKGQQQLEARILKLLEERPGKLADVVEIEQKLAEVRATIEGIQGRLRFLRARVDYSTLTVTMTEPGSVGTSPTETFGGRMKRAFDEGTDALVAFIAGLLTLLMALLPFLLLGLVVWLVVRRTMKRRAAARATQAPAAVTRPYGAPESSPRRGSGE